MLERGLRLGGRDDGCMLATSLGADTSPWPFAIRGIRIASLALVPEAATQGRRGCSYEVLVTTVAGGELVIDLVAWVDGEGKLLVDHALMRPHELSTWLEPMKRQCVLDDLYDSIIQEMNATARQQQYWDACA